MFCSTVLLPMQEQCYVPLGAINKSVKFNGQCICTKVFVGSLVDCLVDDNFLLGILDLLYINIYECLRYNR
jgi:hypothetical protein